MKSRFAAMLAASLAFGAAQAQTKWDMPTPYSDGEFHTRNIKVFVEDVKKATNGGLDITLHTSGSLIKHPDILRAVSTGQVNIAEFLLGQFGNEDPVFAADNVPFVATGYDNAKKFYDWALTPKAQALGAQAKQFQLPSNVATPISPLSPKVSEIKLIDYDFAKYGTTAERKRLLERWDREVGSQAK